MVYISLKADMSFPLLFTVVDEVQGVDDIRCVDNPPVCVCSMYRVYGVGLFLMGIISHHIN